MYFIPVCGFAVPEGKVSDPAMIHPSWLWLIFFRGQNPAGFLADNTEKH